MAIGRLTEVFGRIVRRPERDIPVDLAALLIAAHAHRDLVVSRARSRLDDLAGGIAGADAAQLAVALFVQRGFRGNRRDYGDPCNSYLDVVLERRIGIPITLALVMTEVGRRLGIDVVGIGMPGHFLVGAPGGTGVPARDRRYFDVFDGGRELDADACRGLFVSLHGAEVEFRDADLAPAGPRVVLARILANLCRALAARGDGGAERWAVGLLLEIPDLGVPRRRSLALRLGELGAFREAAAELEDLASLVDGRRAAVLRQEARGVRARAN